MDPIKQLSALFTELPGIGPRQARRFVYSLLRRNSDFLDTLSNALIQLKETVQVCSSCYQFFQKKSSANICSICADKNRDDKMLLIVSDDRDLEHIEKSGIYKGRYFVLGGIVPILSQNPEEKIRTTQLRNTIKNKISENSLNEIILALNITPDGENTEQYLTEFISPIIANTTVKISHLGRGISTGTEIEYSDTETLKNALDNRKNT